MRSSAVIGYNRIIVGTGAAFSRFCRTRVGVSSETMLRAWEFPVEEFNETLKRYERVKPDAAKVEEYCGYICKQWDRRFLRDGEFVEYADGGGGGGG